MMYLGQQEGALPSWRCPLSCLESTYCRLWCQSLYVMSLRQSGHRSIQRCWGLLAPSPGPHHRLSPLPWGSALSMQILGVMSQGRWKKTGLEGLAPVQGHVMPENLEYTLCLCFWNRRDLDHLYVDCHWFLLDKNIPLIGCEEGVKKC